MVSPYTSVAEGFLSFHVIDGIRDEITLKETSNDGSASKIISLIWPKVWKDNKKKDLERQLSTMIEDIHSFGISLLAQSDDVDLHILENDVKNFKTAVETLRQFIIRYDNFNLKVIDYGDHHPFTEVEHKLAKNFNSELSSLIQTINRCFCEHDQIEDEISRTGHGKVYRPFSNEDPFNQKIEELSNKYNNHTVIDDDMEPIVTYSENLTSKLKDYLSELRNLPQG